MVQDLFVYFLRNNLIQNIIIVYLTYTISTIGLLINNGGSVVELKDLELDSEFSSFT